MARTTWHCHLVSHFIESRSRSFAFRPARMPTAGWERRLEEWVRLVLKTLEGDGGRALPALVPQMLLYLPSDLVLQGPEGAQRLRATVR